MNQKKIKRLFLNVIILALISVCFIFSSVELEKLLTDTVWHKVLMEGVTIGGWVSLWESIHILSFERQDFFRRKKELKRFLNAPLLFEYKM